MKDCLFLVLLLAAVSNAFEETSCFSTTSKAEINTTEPTEDHKSEINTTERTEDHKSEINTTERIEDHKPKINTTELTEDHKLEINTTEPTNDHKPEINTTEPTENHGIPIFLSQSLEKLNELLYPSASARKSFLKELIALYVKNISDEFVVKVPLVDLLLPEGFDISNEFLKKQKCLKEREDLCNDAKTIKIVIHNDLFFKEQFAYLSDAELYDLHRTYNNLKACLQFLDLHIEQLTIQKLHIQSIESNVDHEIMATTLKDNSKLKIIPEVVQSKYENKNEDAMVNSY